MKIPLVLLVIASVFTLVFADQAEKGDAGQQHLFAIVVSGKWGFIDCTGKVIIKPSFDAVGQWVFTEEAVAVMLKGKWGYVDRTGSFLIEPRFDLAREFSDGCASVVLVQPEMDNGFLC